MAPAAKKSKTTKTKKATEPVDLHATPMWVLVNDMKKHHIMAITHAPNWVAGNAATFTVNVADKPTSNH